MHILFEQELHTDSHGAHNDHRKTHRHYSGLVDKKTLPNTHEVTLRARYFLGIVTDKTNCNTSRLIFIIVIYLGCFL